MLLRKRYVDDIKNDYNFKLTALREAIKLIPLGQPVDSLIVIVMWFMFRNNPGNQYLWIPLLGTIGAAILWGLYAVHDCNKNMKDSKFVFIRHVFLSAFASICTNAFLMLCFKNATSTNKVLIIAVIIATATSGALSIATFSPVMISWLIPFAILTLASPTLLGNQWTLLWTLVLSIFYIMLTIECFIVSSSFLERYISVKKVESQNETILQLYESEKQYSEKMLLYQKVLEQSPVSVVITDTDGMIEYVNPYFTNLTGYTFEEAKGQNPRILKTDKTETQVFIELWDKLTSGEKWIGEFVNRKKNGEEYEESAIITPIKNTDNKTTHYVGIKENITDRKQKELELKNALIQAEEATNAKSQFLANMSHEIRTPMNAVIGMSYLVLRTELSGKQKDYITKIHQAATSLLGIINDILDFSKIEAGKLELEYAEFNLDTVATDAIGLTTQIGYEKGLEFLYHISPEIPKKLIGDSLRLRQVVTNLVSNAVKFTEHGKVSIDIKMLRKTDEKIQLQFSVSDTGMGISKEEQTKLFQAFSQADNSTTRKFGGTGLGLAISTKLVTIMGGKIWVESKTGEGSTFSFTSWFKIADTGFEQIKNIPKEVCKKKILVVDDSREARGILVEYLEAMKFQTDETSSGERAIDLIKAADQKTPYDVVIIDWKMQQMDGIEVVKRIEEDSRLLHVPKIIMITAFDKDELKKQAENIRVHDVLVKPISQSMLYDSIVNIFKGNESCILVELDSIAKDYEFNKMKILLVEDNEVNRQIGIELLESHGIVVETAVNGLDAVQKIENMSEENPYHMILMDLQMPEMDGFEATRYIRQKNGLIPILAMTARTMLEEREECYNAGMNDHVAKPIDANTLFSTIARWTPDILKNNLFTKSIKNMEETNAFSIIGVNTKAGIKRLAGNEILYKELLLKYSKSQSGIINEMEMAMEKKDYQTVERLAHTLKGVSGNVGAEEVQLLSGELEYSLKDPIDEKIVNEIKDKLEKMTGEISADIEKKLSAIIEKKKAKNQVSENVTNGHLERLIEMLKDNDSEAVEYYDSIGDELFSSVNQDDLSILTRYIMNFRYEDAVNMIEKIARDNNTLSQSMS